MVLPDPAGCGLRVLHLSDSFAPNVGGLELAVAELCAAQARDDHVVAVATATHPRAPAQEIRDGYEVHRLPLALAKVPGAYVEAGRYAFPPIPDPAFARALASLVARFRPDVLHVHGWVLYSAIGAARRARVPVVATAHDLSHLCVTKTMRHHGATPCSGPVLGKCIRCAHHHYGVKGVPLALASGQIGSRRHPQVSQWVAVSNAVAKRGSAPRADDKTPMDVIPTYISDDLLALASDERTANRPPFVPRAAPYLFYAGALGRYKGVDVLIDAFEIIRRSRPDVRLVLAGLPRPDYEVPRVPGVDVAEGVPLSEIVAAWRHAEVGVVPTNSEEGFGRVAVECLAAGTPCVVSAIGGLTDVVTDGSEGLQTPPGDASALAHAVLRLLGDPEWRSRLGAAGRVRARSFMLSEVKPQIDAVYARVIAEHLDTGGGKHHEGERRRQHAASSDVPLGGPVRGGPL